MRRSDWVEAADPGRERARAAEGDLIGRPIVTLELLYDAPDREQVERVAAALRSRVVVSGCGPGRRGRDRLHLRRADDRPALRLIEHNLDVIKTADRIVDLAPRVSRAGACSATGTPEQVARKRGSHAGQFLAELVGAEAAVGSARRRRRLWSKVAAGA